MQCIHKFYLENIAQQSVYEEVYKMRWFLSSSILFEKFTYAR